MYNYIEMYNKLVSNMYIKQKRYPLRKLLEAQNAQTRVGKGN